MLYKILEIYEYNNVHPFQQLRAYFTQYFCAVKLAITFAYPPDLSSNLLCLYMGKRIISRVKYIDYKTFFSFMI